MFMRPKRRSAELDLTGRVDIVRGWFAFQGRRFELERGAIQFTGGDKINPSLDIIARYRLPEYQVDATISGTVEKPTLTLASQPRLEQADILALLIFGRPINALIRTSRALCKKAPSASPPVTSPGGSPIRFPRRWDWTVWAWISARVDFSGGQVGFGHYCREQDLRFDVATALRRARSRGRAGISNRPGLETRHLDQQHRVKRHRYYLAETILGDSDRSIFPMLL